MKEKKPHSTNKILRQKAEEIQKNKPIVADTLRLQGETLKLIHELDVHQIELEMQNEELTLAKEQIEVAAEKYHDLYDFAPSGYFTLSKNGEIRKLNFKAANMLGKERSLLINNRFTLFLTSESKSIFISFLDKIFKNNRKESCEVALSINPDETVYLLINGIAINNNEECIINTNDISQLKNVEKDLRENEEKFRTLFDSNRDSIAIFRINTEGKLGNFIEANASTIDIYGYTKKELMSMNFSDFESVSQKIKKQRILTLLNDGQIDFETIIKTKNGKLRNVEIKSLIINYINEPAVMIITRDITERKQIENYAKKTQENLITILDAIPDLMFEVGIDGIIHHYHSHRHDLLAAPPEVFMGKNFKNILPAEATKACIEAIKEADEKGWSSGKQYSLDLDKGRHWFELAVSPIKENYSKIRHFILLARDITERKLAEIASQENESKLRGVFNVANSGILMVDNNGKFVLFNDWCCEMLGYTREEFSKLNSLDITHPDDHEQSRMFSDNVIKGNDRYQIQKRYLRKDKTFFWAELSASSVRDENNNVIYGIGIIIDITERKEAEAKLIANENFLKQTQIIANLGSYSLDFTTGIWTSSEVLNSIFGFDVDLDKRYEDWTSIIHPEWKQMMMDYFNNDVIGKKENFNKEYKIIRQNDKEERWVFGIGELVFNDKNEPIKMIGTIQDITDRKNAELEIIRSKEEAEKNKEYLHKIINSVGDPIFVKDEQSRMQIANEAFCKLFGLSLKEIVGRTLAEDVGEQEQENFLKIDKKVLEDGIENISEELLTIRDGKTLTISTKKTRFIDANGNKLLVGIIHDITKRKENEKRIEENEKFLKQTQIIANLGSYSLDFTTGKWTSTAILNSIFGIDDDFDRTIEGWKSIIHPDWKTIMQDYLINEVIGKKNNFDKEYKIVKIDNKEERWLHGMGEITFDNEGQPLQLIGSIQDITARKLTDEKLKITSEKFQDLVNSTGGIVWEADASTFNFTYVSKEAERLLGFTAQEWYVEGFWGNHIYPEDKENAVNLCVYYTKKMQSHDFIYRFIAKDGKVIWLRDIVNVVVEEGKPRWLRGVMFNITSQKENEESLRESEEKYRGLVENSPDAVIIYVDGKIVFVNKEGIRMVGAKNKEEIIGKPVLKFIHPDSYESVIKRMEEVILDNNSSDTVEEKIIDLNGKPIDVELKAIPTIYEHQPAIQAIIHDISSRKQSTFELNKMNRVYSLISQINNLILRSRNREELLQEICRIAVTYGKFRMSWIGMLEDDGKTVNTAALYGVENGYFTKENEISILNEPQGMGPTGTSIREGRTVICNNIDTDPFMEIWREKAKERGYHSSISIPIVVLDKIIGSFNLYSEDTNSFSSEEEVELLEKITQNIAFTLESIIFEEERIKTQEKIKQLSRAVEQSPVSIIITNTKGDIEYVNPKFSETTGYSFDEVLGNNPRILKSGHSTEEDYKLMWQTLSNGNEWHGEFHNIRKDGGLFWESASISPILNAQGNVTHYIAIKEDITARKNVEQELIKAKEKAEESDRLKLAFLANMSHEIRTPMNGILGFTELLKAPRISGEEQQEYIEIIEKSGRRMLNIINDIISISKVESGQIEVSLSETNVNEQIHYIHTFFKPETKQKGIRLNIAKELASNETLIKTDKEKLYAILTNLVKNAIKFTNEGSIEFGCEKKEGMLEFFVKDTGLGISDSQKEIIFERFRQANDTISRSHEGSGLGLAISKAYVEMLGGKLWVESQEGKGSSFYFTLPFLSEYKKEKENSTEKENPGIKEENKIKDLKVLIVEDDAISKLLVTIAVKPFSKEILKVSTGFEAIEACQNNPDIDLVMMDINMPEMGGYEATQKIREFNKNLIIIAQTANGMQSDRDNAIASGCNDYISKPVNIASLTELIEKYFKK